MDRLEPAEPDAPGAVEATSPPGPERLLVRREWLLAALALPFAGLFAASIVSWPWRVLGLPGVSGGLTPPGIVLMIGVAAAGIFAMRQRLPMSLLTWPPGAIGAVVLVATGLVATEFDPSTGFAALAIYGAMYLLVLLVAVSLLDHGLPVAIGYTAFFVLTQATRFPVFEMEEAIANASLFTAAAALRSVVEVAAVAWFARRLVTAPVGEANGSAWALVLLAGAHGILASWEGPLLVGDLSLVTASAQAVRWLGLVLMQLGLVFSLSRLRRAFAHFEPRPTGDGTPPDQREPSRPRPFYRRSRRPTPRTRRRR